MIGMPRQMHFSILGYNSAIPVDKDLGVVTMRILTLIRNLCITKAEANAATFGMIKQWLHIRARHDVLVKTVRVGNIEKIRSGKKGRQCQFRKDRYIAPFIRRLIKESQ